MLVGAALALAWLFETEAGLRWALGQAHSASGGRLAFEGARGNLAGVVTIERLRFAADGTTLDVHELNLHADLLAALSARLVVEPLRAASLELTVAPGGGKPASAPTLPFGVRVARAEVERLRIRAAEAVYELRHLRLTELSLGAVTSAVSAQGSLELVDERYPLAATFRLGGRLERLDTRLSVALEQAKGELHALLTPFAESPFETLEARAAPIDLARFDGRMPKTGLSLALKAGMKKHVVSGSLSATNALAGPIDAGRLPIAGLEAAFSSADFGLVQLERLRAALAGGGLLEGRGTLSRAGFDGKLVASRLNLRALRSDLRATDLAGPLEFTLARELQTLRGTLSQPGIRVSAEAIRKGDDVEIRSLHAAAEGGEVSGSGTLRLGEPLSFDARLAAARFDPSAFGDFPPGAISGTVAAHGQLGAELRVDAQWSVSESTFTGLALASRGSARVAGRRVLQADAQASLGTSRASVRGSFGGKADRLEWTLEVPDPGAHVAALARRVSGHLKASGTLAGTWDTPEAVIAAQIERLELPQELHAKLVKIDVSGSLARHEARLAVVSEQGRFQARLHGGFGERWSWRGEIAAMEGTARTAFRLRAPATLAASRERVELGRFEASVGEGRLLVRELSWRPERLASSGEFTGVPAQWLVLAAGLAERLRASALLDGEWSISAGTHLEGMLRVRRASGDLVLLEERPIELGLQSAALDARFTDSGVGIRLDVASRYASAAAGGQLGRDPAAGLIGVGLDSALLAQGQVEFHHARILTQAVLTDARFDGRIGADLQASGTLGAPAFTGMLRGDALSLEVPPYGLYLKGGELRARLEGDRLRVERFSVRAGEGSFSATGTLPLRLAEGNAKLVWQAHNFSVLERPDMRLIASGEGEVGFDGKRFAVSGEVRADRGHFELERRMPKLGDDVLIAGHEKPVKKEKATLPVRLDVDLDLGSNLTVFLQGLEGKLGGRVNVRTNQDGELRAFGRLQTLHATFYAYGQQLQVDPGILIFDGPIDNPALQITAWRRNQAVEAGIQLSGTVRAPRVQLVSQPPVTEGERLSWLVLGRAPTDATKADLGLLQAAAGALLARGDQLPLDRRIARTFGLDEVSFRGSGEVQDRVLAFGKRLSDKLYVSYEQGLGAVASNLVKLDYSLSRRWSLRAETGTSSGWGLFYRFSWE